MCASPAAPATGSLITFGLNNPTRASSEAPGHSGRLANDGNPATFWQAVAGDTNAWLRIDLERIVTVSKMKLTFPTEGNWRYQIEISDDGETNWKLVADQTQTTATAKNAPTRARPRAARTFRARDVCRNARCPSRRAGGDGIDGNHEPAIANVPMLKPDFLRNRFVIRSLGQACIAATALLMQPFTAAAADADAPRAASNGPAHVPAPATGYVEMKIYDGDPPNLLSNAPAERVARNGFIRNVSVPTIRRYPVDESKSTGVAFVVFPGGGYDVR